MQIVGMDCAGKTEKKGIAIGKFAIHTFSILFVAMGNQKQPVADLLLLVPKIL